MHASINATNSWSRRDLLKRFLATGLAVSSPMAAWATDPKARFSIGACDWSIGKRGQVGALQLAAKLGLDGVQVTFGKPGDLSDLRKPEVRQEYVDASRKYGVQIASLGMGILNKVPYATSADAEQWVVDCVDVMPKLNQHIVLLAFFSQGDIKDHPDLQREVARRLRRVAPLAERANVILGIESLLNAQEHIRILDDVGSPAVQVYYDVANMHRQGYDIYREIRQLGRDRICQFHCKENGTLLGQGPIDFVKVKQAIDEIGYQGWLIIESAVDKQLGLEASYTRNQKYLRSVFCGG